MTRAPAQPRPAAAEQTQELAVVKEEKFLTLMAMPNNRERIAAALGDLADPDTFIAQIAIAIQGDPDLQVCTTVSKMDAVHTCATLGLFPTLQQVALIPRRMYKNTPNERCEIDVMPQWQGYKALMLRVPDIADVIPVLVHKTDHFVVEGNAPDIRVVEHRFHPFDSQRTFARPADILGGYARIIYKNGRERDFFVTIDYIEKCRGCAETQAVWNKWYEKQCFKTILRGLHSARIINIDPLVAGRLASLDRHDDCVLGNDPQRITQPRGPQTIAQLNQLITQGSKPTEPIQYPGLARGEIPNDEPTTGQPGAGEAPAGRKQETLLK